MRTRSRTRSENTTSLLSSIILPLVDSGYIRVAQVGRLAQVSSVLNQATLSDNVWASLCQQEYPGTKRLPPSVRTCHRKLYQRWSTPIVKRQRLPPLAPPSCAAEQIQFIFHVKYNDVTIYSASHTGNELPYLLNSHGGGIIVDQPYCFGKAAWNFSEKQRLDYQSGNRPQGLPVKCPIDILKFEATVHVFRTTDSHMCCVYSSKECIPTRLFPLQVHPLVSDQGETITCTTKFDLSKNQEKLSVCFLKHASQQVDRWPLKRSRQAAEMLHRLPYYVYFEVYLEIGVQESGDVCFNEMVIHTMRSDKDADNNDLYFDSSEEEKKHGVTLLHILSELQGMQDRR